MGPQQERVAALSETHVEFLGGATVWVTLAIKSGGAEQRAGIDVKSMPDPVAEAGRQLLEPDLPHGKPPAIRVPLHELLATPAGAVDAAHYAEQRRPPFGGHDIGRDRPPYGVATSLEACVPDGADPLGRYRLKEDDFLFGDCVSRGGATGGVFGREDRDPPVSAGRPSCRCRASSRFEGHDLAAGAEERVAVGPLETIVGRVDREVEAAALGLNPWNAGLVRQNPQHSLAEQAVPRIVGPE
jgi:hypothetical protein